MSLGSKWTKSSRSNPGGNCVEVRRTNNDIVQVRDSKNPHGLVLSPSSIEWDMFMNGVKAQEFNV